MFYASLLTKDHFMNKTVVWERFKSVEVGVCPVTPDPEQNIENDPKLGHMMWPSALFGQKRFLSVAKHSLWHFKFVKLTVWCKISVETLHLALFFA